jgi:uncharacterized protein YkwD
MLVLIVFPLVLAWMLVPAGAKPGGGRPLGRNVAAAAPQSDAVRLAGLVNAERARRRLPALKPLPRLTEVAGAQSARMAKEHRLSASVGLARAIQPASAWAENVHCADSVEQAHRALMRSPARRANILSRSFNALGVGAAPGGCLWVTELFARMPAGTATATTRSGRADGAAPTTTAPTSSTKAVPKTTAAPTTAPAAGAATTVEKLASDLFARLNAERRARGLQALDWDDDLARMAAGWSAQMARTGDFSHRDLGAASGLPGIAKFSALGENIAWVEGYANMGNQLHLGWMRSEGHRKNMLQPGFDSVGIGVVCDGGRAWATQNFGRLDASSAPPVSSATPPEEPIVATRLDGVRC